ncbi:hypothetical protein OVS_02805 [Mycoplasma ovis str. Michigan]|uniref:Uncharacterized protein n=1 Tax=Mycoplasma ovis str. Michigan TaxID=1415773 RepID=A0ABM5P258_9MOLU|nr:hypothetical protein OVS_02805 [Mycoplasma ovis str. Michigan]
MITKSLKKVYWVFSQSLFSEKREREREREKREREREREIHFSRSVCSAINMRYTDVFRTRQNIWERPKRQKSTNKWQGWLSLTNCLNFRYHSLQNFSGFHSTYLKIFERDS